MRKNLMCDITLGLSENDLSAKECNNLKTLGNDEAALTLAVRPLFATDDLLESRTLITLRMGSDVHEGDVKGIGASNANEIIKKLPQKKKEPFNKALIELISKKLETSSSVVEENFEALMHGPMDDMESEFVANNTQYN